VRTSVEILGSLAALVPRRMSIGVYRLPPVARGIRRVLNSALPVGTREVKVISGPLAGTRLILDLRTEKYFWLGTYESQVEASLRRQLKPGMNAWDVGAFIGYHTLLLRRLAGRRRVIAVEPDPVNLARLRRHLAANDAEDVTVVPAAAGAAAGRGQLARKVGHPSETRVISTAQGDCDVVTLDALLERSGPPGLVKMDVEGAEADVLAGAARMVETIRPIWIIEAHGEQGAKAVSMLGEAGYRVAALDGPVEEAVALPSNEARHVVATP
jgi:FkbM family methyltransferase